jgi:histidinol-phosphate aminotransferase
MIKRPAHLKNLKPYKAGKSIEAVTRELGLTKVVKLASNENPLGISPLAVEAITASVGSSNRYADPSGYRLTHKLAERLERAPEQIILGAGVDSLLGYIISAFSNPGDELLTSEGTFTGIYVHANKLDRQLVKIPLDEYRFDLDSLLDGITPRTKIIYIANPNNPTGTIVTRDELASFLEQVPANILVILDEAYFSYAREYDDYPDGLTLDHNNLIVTRTFSKDFGLAGLRIGYAVAAPDLIADLMRIRLPFEPSFTAQEAALAALDDHDFLNRTLTQNRRSLKQLAEQATKLGVHFPPSYANFIMYAFDSSEFAARFTEECLKRGLILRHVEPFGVPGGVRINSGTDDETAFALEVVAKVFPLVERVLAQSTPSH